MRSVRTIAYVAAVLATLRLKVKVRARFALVGVRCASQRRRHQGDPITISRPVNSNLHAILNLHLVGCTSVVCIVNLLVKVRFVILAA